MNTLLETKADKGCLVAIVIGLFILIVCVATGAFSTVMNAITGELNRPKPVSIEQQTVGGAIQDTNGDTAGQLTDYEITFPTGTIDWRVTYSSRAIREGSQSGYAVIDPTYWCLFDDGRWLSCQPVISEIGGDE